MKLTVFAILSAAVATVSALSPIVVPWKVAPQGATDPTLDIYEPTKYEIVEAGKEFTFQWKTAGAPSELVTLVLVYGEEGKMQPVQILGASIPNTGSFKWTPDASVLPASDDKLLYGAQLVVDADGRNQWTNPFKLANEEGPSETETATTTAATETETETTTKATTTRVPTLTPPSNTTITTTTKKPSTTIITTTTPASNDTTVTPKPTRTPTPTEEEDEEPAETTAADSSAGRVVASFGMAGFLVAVFTLLI
jgi:hypothetical protein